MSGVAKPTARNLQILAVAESGLTFRAIGAKFGMSSERVRQIVRDLGGTAKWAEAKKARSEARQRHTKREWYCRNAEKIAARARKWRQENLAAVREKERASALCQ